MTLREQVKSLKAIFTGKLTFEQVAQGINAGIDNANRLTNDAILLFEAGRYPTAASIAILAIEEYGKIGILKEIARNDSAGKVRKRWKDYRSHTKKNVAWILPGLLAQGKANFRDIAAQVFDKNSGHPALLDHIKQLGFYTDCLDNLNWSYPTNRIDKKMAESIIELARFFALAKKVTHEEIEIWVKHFSGISYEDGDSFKKALSEYHREIQDHGLSSDKLDDFLDFAKNQIIPSNEGGEQSR